MILQPTITKSKSMQMPGATSPIPIFHIVTLTLLELNPDNEDALESAARLREAGVEPTPQDA